MIDKVKNVLLDALNLEFISDDAKQADYAEWDSLAYLRVISALEEEFGIVITAENIDHFNSISSIIDEIEKWQKQ